MALNGLRVLSLESRRAKDIESLLVRQGGLAFVAPSVRERAADDDGALAVRFVERLEAGDFDLVICMTGVGLAFVRDAVAPQMPLERLGAALRRVTVLCRGPKPVPVLRSLQVPIDVMIPEPNTWKEIVEAIALRPERRIAVQEYGRPNPEMNGALERLGATVTPFAVYRWELPEDVEPLREAARRLARAEFDVVVFTSSIQLDHLFQIAEEEGVADRVRSVLRGQVAVASIGPVMTAALAGRGFTPDVVPSSPNLGALVKAISEQAAAVVERKQGSSRAQAEHGG